MVLYGNRRIGERAARSTSLRWAGVGREPERERISREREKTKVEEVFRTAVNSVLFRSLVREN